MPVEPLADLHAGLEPIFAQLARDAGWKLGGLVLDVACGAGLKRPLIKEAIGRAGRIVGLDIDLDALQAARASRAPGTHWIAADALRLPLRDAVADGAWCVAALGLLADASVALVEMRRAIRPGGALVVATAERRWAITHSWPLPLYDRLATALALTPRQLWPQPEPAHDLAALLAAAGFSQVQSYAYCIEPLAQTPAHAALPLLPWLALRPLLAPRLPADALLEADDGVAAPEDAELTTLLIAAIGR